MSAVVQHKSTIATNSSISVTLGSAVTKGNLILVAVTESGGESTSLSTSMVSDGVNTYTLATQQYISDAGQPYIAAIFYAIAASSGSLTVNFNDIRGLTDALHVYEITGYDTLDQAGTYSSSSGSNVSSGSVPTSGLTKVANEFVFGIFLGSGDGAGNETWTGQAGNEGTETAQMNNGAQSTFSEGFEVTSTGTQTATATISGGGTPILLPVALIATFLNKAANTPAPTSVNPTSGKQGATISNFTVNGSGFGTAGTLSFSGDGITINSYSTQTNTQIVASITIGPNAATTARDITVTNSSTGYTGTLAGAFTVPVPPPFGGAHGGGTTHDVYALSTPRKPSPKPSPSFTGKLPYLRPPRKRLF